MTGKRFNLIEVNGNIEDSCTQAVYDGGEDVFELLDCMNALHEENEQLTKKIDDLKEERDFYKGHCESEGLLYD